MPRTPPFDGIGIDWADVSADAHRATVRPHERAGTRGVREHTRRYRVTSRSENEDPRDPDSWHDVLTTHDFELARQTAQDIEDVGDISQIQVYETGEDGR